MQRLHRVLAADDSTTSVSVPPALPATRPMATAIALRLASSGSCLAFNSAGKVCWALVPIQRWPRPPSAYTEAAGSGMPAAMRAEWRRPISAQDLGEGRSWSFFRIGDF